ncbi:MAG: hypothetical protein P4L46_15715 [Fimbriimonas sp.]|nr:hypothetical protein [Fimbriimonas sp.]
MNLPEPLADLMKPLFETLPLEHAMPELVPTKRAAEEAIAQVERIVSDPQIRRNPALEAALWLYVDELDRSHMISQGVPGPIGACWHGIMHRREGDFWNSKYWFRQAGSLKLAAGSDPSEFVDRVEAANRENPPELLAQQRSEWATLFEWCANREGA